MKNGAGEMSLSDLLLRVGVKGIAAAVLATMILIGLYFAFYVPKPSTVIPLERTAYYDRLTGSVVLTNNTVSLSSYPSCDIFISGPTKQIKYFETVSCDSLSSTEIGKQDILNLFNNQTGTYTVLINTDSKGEILQFSIGG